MGEQASSGEQGDLGRRWAAAWSAHDPEAVAGIFHDDGEYDDVAFDIVSPGRQGARQWAAGFLASFPDLHVAAIHRAGRHRAARA